MLANDVFVESGCGSHGLDYIIIVANESSANLNNHLELFRTILNTYLELYMWKRLVGFRNRGDTPHETPVFQAVGG